MSYPDIPDHPEIACALRTGYPRPLPPHIKCAECEIELTGESPVYEVDGRRLCEDCFESYIDDMPLEDLAEKLGYNHTTAESLLERSY